MLHRPARWIPFALIAFLLFVVGCGGSNNAASQVLKTPELPTDKQAKCKVSKSQSEPLIVEWPDAARARLESVSRRGLVAVHYEGCELAVLQRCTVKTDKATYSYSAITRKQSTVQIKDADELYASMPVGAVKLESKLQSAGELDVAMTIVGRYETTSTNVFREELEGECQDATHVIAALTVGSFTFSAGSDAEVGGGVSTVVGAGGGGKSTAKRQMLDHDGDEASCAKASLNDKSPPEGCGALLQIEVMPLARGKKPKPVVAVVPVPVPPPAVVEPLPAEGLGTSPGGLGTLTTPKPVKCAKGMHDENGKCVKGPGKPVVATKPGAKKPGTKGGLAASAGATGGVTGSSLSCVAGQHYERGQCVDDERIAEQTPIPPPPPPTCIVGSHLEGNACVVDEQAPKTARVAADPAAYDTPPPPPGTALGERPNPWRAVLAYLAVGGGLSTLGFGYAALTDAGKATTENGCNEATHTCTAEAQSARSQAKTFALISDISLGVTVASIIGIFILPSHVKVGAAPTPHGVAANASWQF